MKVQKYPIYMIIGAIVGFLLGYVVQEKITGQDYGAGQWQRPSDKKFVDDIEGFIRWLSIPLFTAGMGAFLSPVVGATIMAFIATASTLMLIGAGVGVIAVLYLFYKQHVLA